MHDLLNDAAIRAIRYLTGLGTRRVAPTPEAIANSTKFVDLLPEEPIDPAVVLSLLDDVGSPATVATAGPRFLAW